MKLRASTEADTEAIAALFTASVHVVGASRYDAAQREAWAPRPPDPQVWRARLARLQTLLAEEHGALAGFISWEGNGHIDLLFTAPGHERRGVASQLYGRVEEILTGVELHTEASLLARPFFLRQGFEVVEEQQVERNGVMLRRFAMRKPLRR